MNEGLNLTTTTSLTTSASDDNRMVDIVLRRNHNDINYSTVVNDSSESEIGRISGGRSKESPSVNHDMNTRRNIVSLGHNNNPQEFYLPSSPGHINLFGAGDTIDGIYRLNYFLQ